MSRALLRFLGGAALPAVMMLGIWESRSHGAAQGCPLPPGQAAFPRGIALSGEQMCTVKGTVRVTGGIRIGDRAQLILDSSRLRLTGEPPEGHIVVGGAARLSLTGKSTIELDQTQSNRTLVAHDDAQIEIRQGTGTLIGVVVLQDHSVLEIQDGTLVRDFYQTSPARGAGDTQLFDGARLRLTRATVTTPGGNVGGQANHDVIARGHADVRLTDSSFHGGYIIILDHGTLRWDNGRSPGQTNGGVFVGDQGRVEIANATLCDMGLYLTAGTWTTFKPATGGRYAYTLPDRFNIAFENVKLTCGWVFHLPTGVKARFEDFIVDGQALGIALVVGGRRSVHLGRLPVGPRGAAADEPVEALRQVDIDVTLRNSRVNWNLYAFETAQIAVACPQDGDTPSCFETEAYDNAVLRFDPGSVLAASFLSAEDHGRVIITQSVLKRVGNSGGHVRVVGPDASVQIERSRLDATRIVAIDGRARIVESPTPEYVRASGRARVELVNSGLLPREHIEVSDQACVIVKQREQERRYGACP